MIRWPGWISCRDRRVCCGWGLAIDYPTLKLIHVACVGTSDTLFFVRGVWMMRGSPLLNARWVKIVPHVIDSVLLASAITMAVMIRQYPFVAPWVTAKVLALVAYIVLGMVALKRGKARRVRIAAWIAAQLVFLYIVAVALTRSPLPWAG
jgi:uncharacterized membrane protein SirB2